MAKNVGLITLLVGVLKNTITAKVGEMLFDVEDMLCITCNTTQVNPYLLYADYLFVYEMCEGGGTGGVANNKNYNATDGEGYGKGY